MRIDGAPIEGLTPAEVMSKLAGDPGATPIMAIKRNHKNLSVNARVIRIYLPARFAGRLLTGAISQRLLSQFNTLKS